MAAGRRPEDEQSQEVHQQRHDTIHVFIDNKEITQKRSELFRRDGVHLSDKGNYFFFVPLVTKYIKNNSISTKRVCHSFSVRYIIRLSKCALT